MRKTSVLILGRITADCEGVRSVLQAQSDLQLSLRVDEHLPMDPLQGLATVPDVLILVLDSHGEEMLAVLALKPASQRPPMIVVGSANDAASLRRAMQAGSRDYFAMPVPHAELLGAVRRIGKEVSQLRAGGSDRRRQGDGGAVTPGALTAVINAKGGSGASFVAVNLAHIAAVASGVPVALIDLDLQFGALPSALDVEQRNSLLEALAAAEQLDPMALQGYMGKHASGVHVLSAMSDQLPLPWEIRTDSLLRLLALVRQTYAETFIDLPRQIDPLTGMVLAQASRVVLVMQQSLPHVRDAKRMFRVLTSSLGVPRDRVLLVVNRYAENDAVRLRDIQDTVNPAEMTVLPNDFRAVSDSLNLGVPLLQHNRTAELSKSMEALAARVCDSVESAPSVEPTRRGIIDSVGSWLGGLKS